ncbi:hypothetical protein E4U56_006236, partial [Claviceps arundinis]
LLQQVKENERQAEERARALEQEKNAALRLAREITNGVYTPRRRPPAPQFARFQLIRASR